MSFARPRTPPRDGGSQPRSPERRLSYGPSNTGTSSHSVDAAAASQVAAAASLQARARPATATPTRRQTAREGSLLTALQHRRRGESPSSPERRHGGGRAHPSSRPSSAPLHRVFAADIAASRASFAPVGPVLSVRDQLQHSDAQRACSASGSGPRFPSNAEFRAIRPEWSVGPGSYADRRPEAHVPSTVWQVAHDGPDPTGVGGHTTSAHTQRVLEKIKAGGSLGGVLGELCSVEYIAPRAVPKRTLRGPLIARQVAATHASHSREAQLHAQLASFGDGSGNPLAQQMRAADTSFTLANALKHGPRLGGTSDTGLRARIGDPTGPSRASAIRPDWARLQVYVPPSVTGPCLSWGGEFMPTVDPDTGEALHSQARIRALGVRNHVRDNRRAQPTRTRTHEMHRLASQQAELAAKMARVQQHLAEKAALARARYEEDAFEKDPAVRAQRRAELLAQQERASLQRAWLCQIVLARTAIEWRRRMEKQQWEQLRKFAAKRIWYFYARWRAVQQGKIQKILRNKRARDQSRASLSLQPAEVDALLTRTPSSAFLSAPLSSLPLPSSSSSSPSDVSVSPNLRLLLTGAPSELTPRTASAVRRQGLASLVAYRSQEEAAEVIADFLEFTQRNQFQRVKEAMLAFTRKAKRIQRWWRNHLLAMQWRLWIQTLQFLAFRDKCSKHEQEQRTRHSNAKIASFNKGSHHSASASSVSTGPARATRDDQRRSQMRQRSPERAANTTVAAAGSAPSVSSDSSQTFRAHSPHAHKPLAVWDGRNGSHAAFEDEDGVPVHATNATGGQAAASAATMHVGSSAVASTGSLRRSSFSAGGSSFVSPVASSMLGVHPSLFLASVPEVGAAQLQRQLRNRAPFADPAGQMNGDVIERSASARMAQRVMTAFTYEEEHVDASPSVLSSPVASSLPAVSSSSSSCVPLTRRVGGMKKFVVPHRLSAVSAAASQLDRHHQLVQWNVAIWLCKDVLAERMRQARVRFRQWLRVQRIQTMRDELLQHSGTVKPLTDEERQRVAPTHSRTHGQTEKENTHDEHAHGTHDHGIHYQAATTDGVDRNHHPSSQPRSPSASATRIARPAPSPLPCTVSPFSSSVRPPSFFRLLLSSAELFALHRGANLLLSHLDPRWLRDTTVHAPHFLLMRPRQAATHSGAYGHNGRDGDTRTTELGLFTPATMGHKQNLKRLQAERQRQAQLESATAAVATRPPLDPTTGLPLVSSSLPLVSSPSSAVPRPSFPSSLLLPSPSRRSFPVVVHPPSSSFAEGTGSSTTAVTSSLSRTHTIRASATNLHALGHTGSPLAHSNSARFE